MPQAKINLNPSSKKEETLMLFDSDALLYRAYYALPPLKTKNGRLINAVYGFLSVFLGAIKKFEPKFVIAAFDFPAITFRHKKFKDYKAKRKKTPDELRKQFPIIKEILKVFSVPVIEKKNYEADDIIGTIVNLKEKKFPKIKTIIVTGDTDLLSLVNKKTFVYILKKGTKNGELYGEKEVKEKYQGLKPNQLPDLKGLCGDASDNIPGVSGIGEKTAILLIKEFSNLENLYSQIQKNNQFKESLLEKLKKEKEKAFLSKNLAKISQNIPINFRLEKSIWGNFNIEKIKKVFHKYEFKTLFERYFN